MTQKTSPPPDIVIPFEFPFSFPADTVWPYISNFGGWGIWCTALSDMKIEGDGVERPGAIRKFHSSASDITYREYLIEKNDSKRFMKYGAVSRDPPVPFIQKQIITLQIVPDGKEHSKITGDGRITPNAHVSDDIVEQFKIAGLAAYKFMYGTLETYLQNLKLEFVI